MADAEFGEKAEALSRRTHRQDPVVTLAAENRGPGDSALLPRQPFIELAVDSVEVALIVEILETDRIMAGEWMRRGDHDHHPLTKQLVIVQAVVGMIGPTIDRDLKFIALEPLF